MSAREVAKIIYAPHKAFKEIIQNPRYLGPILILLLFVTANFGWGYVQLSKMYSDQTVPDPSELDKWTEETAFWNSNASITLNDSDYISGAYYGNKSIEFKAVSSSQIWIQLNISSSPVNCSGAHGYQNLTFRIKMVDVETSPSNVSLYLFSTNPEDNFCYDLTEKLNATDAINVWNNITVHIGPESQGWKKSTVNADWSNIGGLGLNFTWLSEPNITLLIDGLFFHGLYQPLIEINSSYLITFPISAFMQFIIQWVLLGGTLYLVPKIFKLNTVWKTWLIVAGFALVALFIQIIVFTAVSLAWPDFFISLKYLGGVSGEWQEAYTQTFSPFFTVIWYIDKVVWVWIIALCAIALKLVFEISWPKSFLVAVPSYLLYILVLLFLIPGAVLL
jgi:hypothetical protein